MKNNLMRNGFVALIALVVVAGIRIWGTVTFMNYHEGLLLEKSIIEKAGVSSISEIERVETKSTTNIVYYKTDGSSISEELSSDGTTYYNK